jgi:GrpB-like predicted nucleotidyltransferase (UPF0157 family)
VWGVHVDDGALAGVLRLAPELDEAWVLRGLNVLPEHQRQGLGRILVTAATEWLEDRCCWMVPHTRLQTFYRSAGFVRRPPPAQLVARAERYRAAGHDVCVLGRGEPEDCDERFVLASPVGLQDERARVLTWLSEALPGVEVHEVGSTAVPGLIGKGDLDLLVRPEAHDFDRVRARLDALLPRNPRQLSTTNYQGYTVPSELDVAVQLTVRDGPYDDFLRFLEVLRRRPEEITAYNALKHEWHGRDMGEYRTAKGTFVQRLLGPK